MLDLSEDGFVIGDIYSMRFQNVTQLIPRDEISFVSAQERGNTILLVLGCLALAISLFRGYDLFAGRVRFDANDDTVATIIVLVVGLALIVAYFASRRVGIMLASSGGRMFIQTRGRNRLALLQKVYDDLHTHRPRRFRSPPDYLPPSNGTPPVKPSSRPPA